MLSTALRSLKENKPSKKYGDISFDLLKISSFSKISWTAKAAATATGSGNVTLTFDWDLTINFSVREAESFVIATVGSPYVLDGPQFAIDTSSKVNVNDATSNTQIFDSKLEMYISTIFFFIN